ncbi:MAG: hypothetical protein F4X05_09725 [Rhodothermaceae bacterium]|nr:hypothetical protein [Rhodothermaceae bacterium]MYD19912.1 hypothetical protein [Rhodothermaceae bacterium]MYI44404.1 hypothetical protein [Rhodothermaceae bacterium]MYJ55603.1 hypothetical protein [Rhodothermaceae bacterium]
MSEKTENQQGTIFNGSFEARFPVPGSSQMVDVVGRCTRCWGPISRSTQGDGIECLVCRRAVDAEEAAREFERMKHEMKNNMSRVCKGQGGDYDQSARFVLKILPEMESDVEAFDARIDKANEKIRGHVTRKCNFPIEASPGLLYLQGRILVSGIETLPYDVSPISFADFDIENLVDELGVPSMDESGHWTWPLQMQWKTPPTGRWLRGRLGTVMMAGYTVSLACEILMKAILITRLDRAKRTHDLSDLYMSLPEDCRNRLQADFPQIVDVMEKYRHSFGKKRYFEPVFTPEVLWALVDADRVWGLGKAARVLVDECLIEGLNGTVDLNWNSKSDMIFGMCKDGDGKLIEGQQQVTYGINIEYNESAVAWDKLMQE